MNHKTVAALVFSGVAMAATARTDEAVAPPAAESPPTPRLRMALLIGYDRWDAAAELAPPGELLPFAPVAGAIKADGTTIDLTTHWTVRRGPHADLLVGFESGAFFHENSRSFEVEILPSGSTATGKVDLRGFYAGPGLRAVFRTRSHVWPAVGIVPAFCMADAAVLIGGGFPAEEYPNTYALCVQGTAGAEILFGKPRPRWAVRIEGRLRWSNFGELPGFGPDSGTLGGTAWGVQIGGVYLR